MLNGTKFWITNAPEANVLVVYAKTDMAAGPEVITAFLIERDMKGFSTSQKLDKMGMRGSDTAELVFQDCEAAPEQVMGGEGNGAEVMLGLDYERVVLSAGPSAYHASLSRRGAALCARAQAVRPAHRQFRADEAKVADMYVALNSARAYVYAVARACDAGETTRYGGAIRLSRRKMP